MSEASTQRDPSARYDLTYKLGQFMDRQLVFPLLEFLQVKQLYPNEEILRGKLELLSGSNMIDFAMEIQRELSTEPPPPEMMKRREEVVAQLKRLQEECAPLIRIFDDVEGIKRLKQEKLFTFQHLSEHHDITAETVDSLYSYAKFQFDCGNYSTAAEYLFFYRSLSTNSEKAFSALWGKLAAEILLQNWEIALEDLNRLKDTIETRSFISPLVQLQQRSWLIHWALFVFFNHNNGRNLIIDMFMQDRYLNAIQTNCPHVLRYLTTAVVTNKRRRSVLQDLTKVIQQESYTYRDPIVEFLECLYVHYDFEGAQTKLKECEVLLDNDFFLVACRDDFVENARLFIFENYTRIHTVMDIGMLAQKLNMTQEEAERWVVNLVRDTRVEEAKIDAQGNRVIMGATYPSVYHQVMERTKGLAFRTYVLANNLEKGIPHDVPAS